MFTTSTVIDKKAFYSLNKKTFKYMAFSFAFAIILLTCSICLTVLNFKHDTFTYILVAITLFLAFFLLFTYKRAEKSSVGQTTHFTFNENSFLVNTEQGSSELNYSIITSVKREGKYLFLYLNKSQAYIVNTENLSQDFFDFITEKTTPQIEVE